MSKLENFMNILTKYGTELGINFFELLKDGTEWITKGLTLSLMILSAPLVLIGAVSKLIVDSIKGER